MTNDCDPAGRLMALRKAANDAETFDNRIAALEDLHALEVSLGVNIVTVVWTETGEAEEIDQTREEIESVKFEKLRASPT